MVSIFSSMICVARRFSRAICMVKKPEVNPVNKADTDTPMTLMLTLTSTSEKACVKRRSERGEDKRFFSFIARTVPTNAIEQDCCHFSAWKPPGDDVV